MAKAGASDSLKRAVILAAGRGTRMRSPAPDVHLTPGQAEMASRGLKAMIPIAGRPFLDYKLHALAEAGIFEAIVVVGPEHGDLQEHYRSHPPERVALHFVAQQEPLGSAHALLSAEPWCGEEPFAQVNSDNFYPPTVLAALHTLPGSGLVAFRRDTLTVGGNMTAERTSNCGLVVVDGEERVVEVLEKPGLVFLDAQTPPVWLSMTCWRFEKSIFEACRSVGRSSRGEYEIPDAVQFAIAELGVVFRMVGSTDTVLDLSRRSDIPAVERLLADTEVCP